MAKKDSIAKKLNRRKFLAAAAFAGVGSAARPAGAATTAAPQPERRLPSNTHVAAVAPNVPDIAPYATEGRPGSDFMVDVIKTLDIKYLPANPASSYRALHESLIDYGKNAMPEFLTCTHEEGGVGIAHGYYKIANGPLLTTCHGTVGLRHATMNVYNACRSRSGISARSSTFRNTCRSRSRRAKFRCSSSEPMAPAFRAGAGARRYAPSGGSR